MALNYTLLPSRNYPNNKDYYQNLNYFNISSMAASILLLILNVIIFIVTLLKLKMRINIHLIGRSAFLCAVYPLISIAAVFTIFIPKAWLICHTIMHLSFTAAAVVFQRLCFQYLDNDINYTKQSNSEEVVLQTLPCCCCCICLPVTTLSPKTYRILQYMVWQMPIIQGSIMATLNAIYYQKQDLYTNVMVYFAPFLIVSIIIGLWSLNIGVQIVTKIRKDCGLRRKMFCLQLILLLCKLQYVILDTQLDKLKLWSTYPDNYSVLKETIINVIILSEIALVSLLAQHTYTIRDQ